MLKFSVTSHEESEGRWNPRLPFFLDIRRKKDGTVFSSLGRPHFTHKEIPWYSFMLDVAWTPGLLNTDRKNKSLENFHGP